MDDPTATVLFAALFVIVQVVVVRVTDRAIPARITRLPSWWQWWPLHRETILETRGFALYFILSLFIALMVATVVLSVTGPGVRDVHPAVIMIGVPFTIFQFLWMLRLWLWSRR